MKKLIATSVLSLAAILAAGAASAASVFYISGSGDGPSPYQFTLSGNLTQTGQEVDGGPIPRAIYYSGDLNLSLQVGGTTYEADLSNIDLTVYAHSFTLYALGSGYEVDAGCVLGDGCYTYAYRDAPARTFLAGGASPNLQETWLVTPAPALVPEPTTWALAILGLGLLGAGLRRRSPQALVPA